MDIDLKHWEDHSEELSEIKPLVKDIQSVGMCGSPQPEYLFCLSYSLRNKGEIVEIGTCAGTSLIVLAFAQKLKGNGSVVNTIDLKKHPSLDLHVAKANVKDWANIINGDSFEISKKWDKPIELLWIDGDHRYQGAFSDISNWEKFVVKGGMIALHDYRDGTGVSRAVYETLLAKPWIWRVVSDRKYGSIFVVERVADDGGATKQWADTLSDQSKDSISSFCRSFLSRLKGRLLGARS